MLLEPPMRALAQLDDPVFLGVLLRSLAWAAVAFVGLAAGLGWGFHTLARDWLGHAGWLAWLGAFAGPFGAALLASILFLPLAGLIATLQLDRVAEAVERRWYPLLPRAVPAPLLDQVWDGVALALKVLGMQLLALAVTLLLPGPGLLLGWMIAAWAIGRGLFVAVAMRRMDRGKARALCRRQMAAVLAQGGLIAAVGTMPLLNLLAPSLGTAALVHLLHLSGRDGS